MCRRQALLALDVTLQWDANKESGVSGYLIYYKTGQSGDRKKENYTNQVEIGVEQDEYKDDPSLIVQFTISGCWLISRPSA